MINVLLANELHPALYFFLHFHSSPLQNYNTVTSANIFIFSGQAKLEVTKEMNAMN